MTDRELLELAAKAAGIELRWYPDGTAYSDSRCKGYWDVWNPLTDDGDALRLAVYLCLAVRLLEKCVFVESNPDTLLGFSSVSEMEMYAGDPYAATRLAVVRAAAEIGKGMK